MNLFDLLEPDAPVRATDPASSRAGAGLVRLRARKAEAMRAIGWFIERPVEGYDGRFTTDDVYDTLRRYTPAGWERGAVASRMSQLVRSGLIEHAGTLPGRHGIDVLAFRVTDAGRAWLRTDSES